MCYLQFAMKDLSPDRWKEIESVMDQALDLDPDKREAFVAEACGEDKELRMKVMSLLGAGEKAPNFLEGSHPDDLKKVLHELASEVETEDKDANLGRTLGPYRLIRRLGQGGMGQVYLGVRDDEAYKKFVAVKIIRRGMDTDEILHRFRTERRILASLTHPNIARLLDGGATEDGLSYFVMDYVEGVTITRYCDDHLLSIRERLELFQKVCSAVQYAHQNLIVHRDLKPSNILVTAGGEVKLLDFGIAKFVNPDDAGFTVPVTVAEKRAMTPEYASPEQVRGEVVTTVSDVYQLGILLYELLTGSRPYIFSSGRQVEIERIICESEPERPSTAITLVNTSGEERESKDVSGLRGTPIERLRKQLSGDLDRIVLMALRKDADRRYQSADQFLEDIKRFLAGLPVQAQSDTWIYRSRKFVRRNRVGVVASVALVVMLVAVAGLALRFAFVTAEQNEAIRIESEKKDQVKELVLGMFSFADPEIARGREITARELLERGSARIERELDNQPDVKAEMLQTIGTVYMQLGLFDSAEPELTRALEMRRELFGAEDSDELAQSMYEMALWMEEMGRGEEADTLHREALDMRDRLFDRPNADIAASLNDYGVLMLSYFDSVSYAESLFRQALDMRLELEGPASKDISETLSNLALAVNYRDSLWEESEPYYRQALAMQEDLLGTDHPFVASNLHNLGALMMDLESYDEAEILLRRAIDLRKQLYGERHGNVARSENYLGRLLHKTGDLNEAESMYRESLAIHVEEFGEVHPIVGRDRQMLSRVLLDRGLTGAASVEIERALRIFGETLPPDYPWFEQAREEAALIRASITRY